ncbi:MAG: hypothetical protein KBC48_00525 [Candidatus Pacebacteria bacterium]|nr:hypothetical protein [Candidatus Paceibacterota bacterium]
MKMNFRPDKSLQSRHYGWHISRRRAAALVIIFGLALFGQSLLRRGLESPVAVVTYPVLALQKMFDHNRLVWSEYLSRQRSLTIENLRLKEENEQLKLESLSAKQTAENYRSLRASLGQYAPRLDQVLAQVLVTPERAPFDTVIVDLGKNNSTRPIVRGHIAESGGVVLGEVVEVYPYSAKVRLFSSAGLELPVVVGPSKIPATAIGRGGGNFIASMPRGVTVALGDLVTVPALGERVLATVGAVDNDPEEPLQKVYLKSPVNLFTLNWLWINAR